MVSLHGTVPREQTTVNTACAPKPNAILECKGLGQQVTGEEGEMGGGRKAGGINQQDPRRMKPITLWQTSTWFYHIHLHKSNSEKVGEHTLKHHLAWSKKKVVYQHIFLQNTSD